MARRRLKLSATRTSFQHADTLISVIGPATAPTSMIVLDTEAGARPTTGATTTVQVGMGTNEEVNVGCIVKNINLFIQAGVNSDTATEEDQSNGWLEWAIVMVKESETVLPITLLGIQTVGNVATNMYRNECIYSGCIPMGKAQPNYQEIKIKVPKFKQKITYGDQWRLIMAFRDVSAASIETNSAFIVSSFMYKSWQ